MSEDLRNLSRKARRQSSVWIPEPKGQQFSHQATRTDVHEKLGRQFFEDYREQIKHWNDSSANHAVFMRGPFLLKEGGRGRVGGIIVPLLEDDLGNDADKPVVQLISPKFDEKDVSAGWGGFAFLTRRDERITAQRGDVMFILRPRHAPSATTWIPCIWRHSEGHGAMRPTDRDRMHHHHACTAGDPKTRVCCGCSGVANLVPGIFPAIWVCLERLQVVYPGWTTIINGDMTTYAAV